VIFSFPSLLFLLSNGSLFFPILGDLDDFAATQSRSFHAPKVPNLDIPDGLRHLEEVEGKVELGRRLTMFGPNNAALDFLFDTFISDFYTPTGEDNPTEEVVTYFANLGIMDIETAVMSDFLIHTIPGHIVLVNIIAQHILDGEISRNEIFFDCSGTTFRNIMEQRVLTGCIGPQKYVVGEGNNGDPDSPRYYPRLLDFEALASNGVLYQVDRVILPNTLPLPIAPYGGGTILINEDLLLMFPQYYNVHTVLHTGTIFQSPPPSPSPSTAPDSGS
jgi:hypothetical protein